LARRKKEIERSERGDRGSGGYVFVGEKVLSKN
jgi:hypothetical protein